MDNSNTYSSNIIALKENEIYFGVSRQKDKVMFKGSRIILVSNLDSNAIARRL